MDNTDHPEKRLRAGWADNDILTNLLPATSSLQARDFEPRTLFLTNLLKFEQLQCRAFVGGGVVLVIVEQVF